MGNRLGEALSPYLQQHAGNPVDWVEWGPEAFEEARRRGVPVFLSVGYSACHWCHVMAHESFEDPHTAAYLNENFVSIKVDREERPDVDAVYMAATTAMTGQGGWPMSVWLDHEGRAFHAGTYFPPEPMHGRPSFRMVLEAITDAWRTRRDQVEASAVAIDRALAEREQAAPPADAPVDPMQTIVVAAQELAASFDRVDAGFGGAPKFPPAMVMEFLLRHYEMTGETESLAMVEATAEAMARGGLYDQLGGGFARYSVDARWQIPHFEKMLYDNALLLRVYTHLWCRTDNDLVRRIAEETAEFLVRDMTTPQGAFAAALDADSAPPGQPDATPVEGAAYVWTPDQLDEVLGTEEGQWAADIFGVTVSGNFEHGSSTLTLPVDPPDFRRFDAIRAGLLEARGRRPAPHRDDKVVASWNGLAIGALAQAGVVFDRPEWIVAASRAAEVLAEHHITDEYRLLRVSRDGRPGAAIGMLDDYGNVVDGLAWLFAATGDPAVIHRAQILTAEMVQHFAMPDGTFCDAPDDGDRLVRRPRDPGDNATPSGVGSAVMALVTMAGLTGRRDWRRTADLALGRLDEMMQTHPRFAGWSLSALVAAVAGPTQVAVVGESDDPRFRDLRRAAFRQARCGTVVAVGHGEDPVELLAGRPLHREATAYVCRDFTCSFPVTRDDDLVDQLAGQPSSS